MHLFKNYEINMFGSELECLNHNSALGGGGNG